MTREELDKIDKAIPKEQAQSDAPAIARTTISPRARPILEQVEQLAPAHNCSSKR